MHVLSVSVVMCTYNGELYIKHQLDSILEQTYPPKEIIIQDDGSTDRTWDILNEYMKICNKINIFRNSKNLGPNKNFISAFAKATGDYIAVADQDDVWVKNRLEVYVQALSTQNLKLVYADSYVSDHELRPLFVTNFSHLNAENLIWMSGPPGHSVLFARSILSSIKNIDEVDFFYDWLINITAYMSGNVLKIDQVLTYWRRHNLTSSNLDYVPPLVEYKPPFSLMAEVVMNLSKRHSIKNFKWKYHNLFLIFRNFKNLKEGKRIFLFLFYYKREKFVSMLISCIYYLFINNDTSIKKKIKAIYTPMYKYYYFKRDGAGLRGKE